MFVVALITDWRTSYSGTMIQGGMAYQNGYITVPQAGLYYIYFQLWIDPQPGNSPYSSALLQLNDVTVGGLYSYISGTPTGSQDRTRYTGMLRRLEKGDRLSVRAYHSNRYYFEHPYTYFGAYMLF